jgi:hypothetical protein
MARSVSAGGTIVETPDSWDVRDTVQATRGRRAAARSASAGARAAEAGATPADAELLDALEGQGLRVADSLDLAPRAGASGGELTFDVPLARDEEAVVLLEQDGVYSWVFAADSRPADSGSKGRPGRRAGRVARFRIPVDAPAGGPGPQPRGFLGSVVGRIRTVVLKFVAKLAVSAGMAFLERNVREGLVHVGSSDTEGWRPVDTLADFAWPSDRPPRILLLVHGTFSSTLGSFGALGATPYGQALLGRLLTHYDAVLGYDHRTLSDDPDANAREMLAALRTAAWDPAAPPVIDAVAFSRGGLVLRSLLERVVPESDFRPEIGRAIFVGCTNSGTQLAEPEKWHALSDLYTNLAVAAGRAVSLIPSARPVAGLVTELVRGLGALVKYLATHVVNDRAIPGLAAMEPDGEFVIVLNRLQPGQPAAADCRYYAITGEFEPRGSSGLGFPAKLGLRLADGFMDRLMSEANDLVVHTASMAAVDLGEGDFVKERFAFHPDRGVYHTVYFHEVETVATLARWLEIVEPAAGDAASAGAPKAA